MTEVTAEAPREIAPPPVFHFDPDAGPDHLPGGSRGFPPRSAFRMSSLKWLPGILLLLCTLAVQWAYLNLAVFSQDERYRDHILTVCRIAGCRVPDYHHPALLETRDLMIRTHPEAPQALTADVLLRNGGAFRQKFPGLRLDFTDVRGNLVASRVFQPDEYLSGEMQGSRYLLAHTEVRLSLEMVDPGVNALGYQMQVVGI